MKDIFTKNGSISRHAVVAMVLLCIQLAIGTPQLPKAQAQRQDGSVTYSSTPIVVGIAPGQTARFCVGTSNLSPRELDWTVQISTDRGVVLFQLPEMHSPAGEWRCGNVPYGSLGVMGEPGTGRVQVAAGLRLRASLGTRSSEFISSWELVGENGATEAGGLIFWAITHDNNI